MSQNFGVITLNPGGTQTITNITAAGVLVGNTAAPTNPGKLRRINVQGVGTGGAYDFYDINFIGAYSASIQYQPGQGVSSGGNYYVNIQASLGVATSNAANWTQVFPSVALPYNAVGIVTGGIVAPDWPFVNGIYLAAVPTGGTPIISVAIDP